MMKERISIPLPNGGVVKLTLEELLSSSIRLEQVGLLEGRREHLPDDDDIPVDKYIHRKKKYYREW